MSTEPVVDVLLRSEEPAIRYKTLVNVLKEDPESLSIRKLQKEVQTSHLAQTLLAHRGVDGRVIKPKPVYAKWQGAHWTMAILADIGYPKGDMGLVPIRDQLQETWLADTWYSEFECESKAKVYGRRGVPVMQGRHRRCASQQSNALWSILRLGLENNQTKHFVERLLHWQWPDGGWNCDKKPTAHHSSFMESILPLRALSLYADRFDHQQARDAAKRAAEVFLKRHLYLKQSNGAVIKAEFAKLHYPLYWHYDILHGLKVLAEADMVRDPRAKPALDLLLEKRLPDGGWPAESKYYKASRQIALGNDFIDWGGTSARRMNPWVTVDALYVLQAAGLVSRPT